MRPESADVCLCVENGHAGCICSAAHHGVEECGEKRRCEQMGREELEELVRENGIRFAINSHICQD
jgi:precorrin-6x reductase